MSKHLVINTATYLHDYKLKLDFNDGKEVEIDFEKFICDSVHPDIQKYINLNEFKKIHLNYGDLEWNDHELAFPIRGLDQ